MPKLHRNQDRSAGLSMTLMFGDRLKGCPNGTQYRKRSFPPVPIRYNTFFFSYCRKKSYFPLASLAGAWCALIARVRTATHTLSWRSPIFPKQESGPKTARKIVVLFAWLMSSLKRTSARTFTLSKRAQFFVYFLKSICCVQVGQLFKCSRTSASSMRALPFERRKLALKVEHSLQS